MKINEKLDFLMKVTGTTNNTLGKYLTFDGSYISRIRSGKRNFPKNPPFAEPASAFFAAHIRDEYQRKLAAELICSGKTWPDNERTAQKMIFEWLTQEEDQMKASVGSILSGIASVRAPGLPPISELPENSAGEPEKISLFYGNEGKRKAVEQFLSEVGRMDAPPQLLLYSNEEFDWMYEDPAFARKWAMLLFAYIRKGGRIKIAHTISRASGEMLVALQKWVPVYMTGAIEPYYYPKTLDRVFRRTIFIAEGYAAITASSVGEHTEGAINCLTHDPEAVQALEREYWDFFELCRPLMKIYNLAEGEQFDRILSGFHAECENTLTYCTVPSGYTLPAETARHMADRTGHTRLIRYQAEGEKAFSEIMDHHKTLIEFLNLPDMEQLRAGNIPFPVCRLAELSEKEMPCYTVSEFAAHLDSMIDRLKHFPDYHVVLSAAIPENEQVYIKEDLSAILVKSDFPQIAFVLQEPRMVSAFWEYLRGLSGRNTKKSDTISRLEEIRQQLSDLI